MIFNSNPNRRSGPGRFILAGSVLLGAVLGAQPALACTLSNWSSSSGSVVANNPLGNDGDPGGDTTSVPRYSGLCGMRATGGTGWVQDDRPGGINRIVARFYVLNGLSGGSANIYQGFSTTGGTGPLFTVSLNSAGQVTLTDVATGQNVSQNSATNWASVEIDFGQGAAGTGFINLSVNGQTPAELAVSNAGNPLQSIRLGNLNGGGTGTLGFDAYESRRTTAVGRLLRGDANGNGTVDIFDAISVVNESGSGTLAAGQPDCNENGVVDIFDAICVVNLAAQG